MAQLRCADGRLLDVVPVPVLDRTGALYECTLRLLLDGAPFGHVGQRAAGVLGAVSARLDTEQQLTGTAERGVRGWARAQGTDPDVVWSGLRPHLPRDAELFCLRARDPDDDPLPGELRALVSPVRTWQDGAGWRTRTDVVVQAWGDDGAGVRAVLDLPGLCVWLDALLGECATAATP
ncbi:MAG: hypothetical protein JWO60_2145 [Frankiales bacterium]|nr:hypothetical protein [Frankiales bacterium]